MNNQLYSSLINSISRSVKKILNEDVINFNPIDYSDNAETIDNQTISNLTYKYFPKNKNELQKIIIKKLKENIKYPYLNDIDTSEITDMNSLFSNYENDYLQKMVLIQLIL